MGFWGFGVLGFWGPRAYWKLPSDFYRGGVGMYSLAISFGIEFTNVPDNNAPSNAIPDVLIVSGTRQLIYSYPTPPKLNRTSYDYSVTVDEKNFQAYLTDSNWYNAATDQDAALKNIVRQNVTREQLLSILSYISGIYIRASYAMNAARQSTIRNVRVQIVQHSTNNRLPAGPKSVEVCPCPVGYAGLSCERCAKGYQYDQAKLNVYPRTCIPCTCHNHSTDCDMETGHCMDCLHNTDGYDCEKCDPGFIRLTGDPQHHCIPCSCPGSDPTRHFADGCRTDTDDPTKYQCNCRPGYTGDKCERCADGYCGDPVNGVQCQPIRITMDYVYIFAQIEQKKNFTCQMQPSCAILDQDMTWSRVVDNVPTAIDSRSRITTQSNKTLGALFFDYILPPLAGPYQCCGKQGAWQSCSTGTLRVDQPPTLSARLVSNLSRCAIEQEAVEYTCVSAPAMDYLHYDFQTQWPATNYTVKGNRLTLPDARLVYNNSSLTCSVHPNWVADESAEAGSNPLTLCVKPVSLKFSLFTAPPGQLSQNTPVFSSSDNRLTPITGPIEEDTDVLLECRIEPYGIAEALHKIVLEHLHTGDLPESHQIIVQNKSLVQIIFPRVSKAMHEGPFLCKARFGRYAPQNMKLRGELDITQNMPTLTLAAKPWYIEDENILFTCNMSNAPIRLYQFTIYRVLGPDTRDELAISTIYTIARAKTSHSGNYVCNAKRLDDENDEGVFSPETSIAVYVPHLNAAPLQRMVAPGKNGNFDCAIRPHVIMADAALARSRLTRNRYGPT